MDLLLNRLIDLLLDYYGPTPYALVFGMLLLCGLGLPLPEDLTLIAGGLMVYFGVCEPWPMVLTGLVGVLLGDSMMWFLGHRYGKKLVKLKFIKVLLSEERLNYARKKLQSPKAAHILFWARFMPGFRAPLFFSSGLLKIPYSMLFIWDGLAALLSVPAIILSLYYYGDRFELAIRWIQRVEHGIVLLVLAGVAILFAKIYIDKRRLRSLR